MQAPFKQVEETKDVEMIDTSSGPKKELKERSWDALCNIRSELVGSSEAEV